MVNTKSRYYTLKYNFGMVSLVCDYVSPYRVPIAVLIYIITPAAVTVLLSLAETWPLSPRRSLLWSRSWSGHKYIFIVTLLDSWVKPLINITLGQCILGSTLVCINVSPYSVRSWAILVHRYIYNFLINLDLN